jgi:hypothetical protein
MAASELFATGLIAVPTAEIVASVAATDDHALSTFEQGPRTEPMSAGRKSVLAHDSATEVAAAVHVAAVEIVSADVAERAYLDAAGHHSAAAPAAVAHRSAAIASAAGLVAAVEEDVAADIGAAAAMAH